MTSIDHVMVRDDAWLPAGPDQAWKTLSSETAQKKSRQSGDSAPSPGSRDFDTQGTEPADFDTSPSTKHSRSSLNTLPTISLARAVSQLFLSASP